MGYNSEFAASRGPVVFDLETAPLPNAADYLEPVTAAKNLKDPAKIAADLEERTAARDGLVGLDPNVARIVCLGAAVGGVATILTACPTEDAEAEALGAFWTLQQGRRLVGFRIREFDLPMLIQRSRYLGIPAPAIDLGRYSRANRIVDLFDLLTFQDSQRTFAMRRTLKAFCRRFGIAVEDETTGADIAAMVVAQDWAGIEAHCASDVRLTVALAERLGVVPAALPLEVP